MRKASAGLALALGSALALALPAVAHAQGAEGTIDVADSGDTAWVLTASVLVIAAWMEELGLGPDRAEALVLRPVEDILLARHGHEVGPRLYRLFIAAFRHDAPTTRVDPAHADRRADPRTGRDGPRAGDGHGTATT